MNDEKKAELIYKEMHKYQYRSEQIQAIIDVLVELKNDEEIEVMSDKK